MSCHDIGRGLNSVVDVVVELYDHGKISRDAALKITHAARNGVHWFDGNEDEAVDSILRKRCGYCLRKMEPGEPLYPVCKYYYHWPYPVEEDFQEILATYMLCTDCYDTLVERSSGDPAAGPNGRKGIEEKCSWDEWHAQ